MKHKPHARQRKLSKGSDAISQQTLEVEALESRILYSAAPVEAPAEAQTEAPVEAAPAAPAPAAAPAAAPTAVQEATPQVHAAPVAVQAETTIPSDQEVTLVDVQEDTATPLTQEAVAEVAEAARQRWIDSGISDAQIEVLDNLSYQIKDLQGSRIGSTQGSTVILDSDAAGRGWFVDSTPLEDEEFSLIGGTLLGTTEAATGRLDLLTTILHEQGHALGVEEPNSAGPDIMDKYLSVGERRLPTDGRAEGAVVGSHTEIEYLTVDLVHETFETNGNGSRYTTSGEGNLGVNDYYQRVTDSNGNSPGGDSPDIDLDADDVGGQDPGYSNFQGSTYFAAEDVDNNGASSDNFRILDLNPINTASHTNLVFSGLFGAGDTDSTPSYDSDQFMAVLISSDGGSTYIPKLVFRGDVTTIDVSNVPARQVSVITPGTDPNSDTLAELGAKLSGGQIAPSGLLGDEFKFMGPDTGGTAANGTTLGTALQNFAFNVDDAAEIRIRVVLMSDGSNVEWAFDSLKLTGDTVTVNTAPTAVLNAPNVTEANIGDISYSFTVTYADNTNIDVSDIDTSDVTVTGPAGVTISGVTVDFPTDGSPRVATYTITPPGGAWDGADNGTYTVNMVANQVSDTDGTPLFVAAGSLGSFTVNATNTAPTVTDVLAEDVIFTDLGDTSYSFTVEFTDTVHDIDVSTITTSAVSVSKGGGGTLTVTGVTTNPAVDGSPVTATFTVTPPGGSWDAGDLDTYTIALLANQVADEHGAFVAANASLATFAVIPNKLLNETFETDGNGTRYSTTGEAFPDDQNYYGRVTDSNGNTAGGDSPNITLDDTLLSEYNDFQGKRYFAAEDVDQVGTLSPFRTVDISPINTSGHTNLQFSGLFGAGGNDATPAYDAISFMAVLVSIDGGTTYLPKLVFRADVTAGDATDFAARQVSVIAPGSDPTSDTLAELGAKLSAGQIAPSNTVGDSFDFIAADGLTGASGTLLGAALQNFSVGLSDAAETRIRVVLHSDNANIEWAFDSLMVTGDPVGTPEITVEHVATSVEIPDGDTTPTGIGDEGTDFGSVDTATGSEVRTFRIRNDGAANLVLSGQPTITGDAGGHYTASAISGAGLTLAPAEVRTFTVTFDPTADGVHTATVNIGSNDADEAAYDFLLTGTGTTIAPPATEETGVSISGTDLVITDVLGGSNDDDLTISLSGTTLTIVDNNGNGIDLGAVTGTGDGTDTVTIDTGLFAGGIVWDALDGNDTLRIDFAPGNFNRTITYNGGANGALGDQLVLTGGSFTDTIYNFTNENDGNIVITGNSLITYTGLEPITSTITAANVTLNYSGVAETITVTGVGASTRVDSTAGEVVTFTNPSTALNINAGDGNDTVNVNGFGTGFAAALSVLGQGGTGDIINYRADGVSLGAGNGATFTAERIDFVLGDLTTSDGNITVTGTGGSGNYIGVRLLGSSLTTGTGSIDIDGQGGDTGSNNQGVQIVGSSTLTTGGGNIDIDGTGGGAGANNYGVAVLSGSSLSATGGGTVNIDGTGSTTGTSGNHGVFFTTGTSASVVNGALTIVGTGAGSIGISNGINAVGATLSSSGSGSITGTGSSSASGSGNQGIVLNNTAITTAAGTGSITLNGTGSSSGLSNNEGVRLANSDLTSGGAIDVDGLGGGTGAGTNNTGVAFLTGSTAMAGGAGSLTIDGSGGSGTYFNRGVFITGAGSSISAPGGRVDIAGTGNGSLSLNRGVEIAYASVSSGNGTTITGRGSTSASGTFNTGVYLLSTAVGNVSSIDGFGGTGSSYNEGVRMIGGSLTGSGTVTGTAHASTTGLFNSGVYLSGAALGGTTVTGFGGGLGSGLGNYNHGVYDISHTGGTLSGTAGSGANSLAIA